MYSDDLSNYIHSSNYDSFPTSVIDHCKLLILDTLGAMISASSSTYPISGILNNFTQSNSGPPESTIIGSSLKTSSITAALVNGTLAYYCDIESIHLRSILHALAVILPTSLAIGEKLHINGPTMISSLIVGVDVASRVSYSLTPSGQYSRSFHPSSVCGCFGAASASSFILDLNPKQIKNALGLAGCQSSGLMSWESDHTEMSRPFQMGVAARNGLTSSLFAAEGLAGPEVFEGKYNIFNAFTNSPQIENLNKNLGVTYELSDIAFKKYSCCAFLQSGVDALLSLIQNSNLDPKNISEINLKFASKGAAVIDNNQMRSHNAQYILSTAAFKNGIMMDDLLQDQYLDSRISNLSERINVIYDNDLDNSFPSKYSSILSIKMDDGQNYEKYVENSPGTSDNPMSRLEIESKFKKLSSNVINNDLSDSIIKLVNNLHNVDDICSLSELLSY